MRFYGIMAVAKMPPRSGAYDSREVGEIWSLDSDHNLDHLRFRTMWKQCLKEHTKALISDTKAPKSLIEQGKNRHFSVWDVDAAGSNPVTPTISSVHNESDEHSIFFAYIFLFGAVFLLFFFCYAVVGR